MLVDELREVPDGLEDLSREALVVDLEAEPLLEDAPERRFSEPNRWGGGELEEAPVRPEVVVEVRYDKVQGRRFRHGTKLLRLRPDKDPAQCTWRELRPPAEPGASIARLLER